MGNKNNSKFEKFLFRLGIIGLILAFLSPITLFTLKVVSNMADEQPKPNGIVSNVTEKNGEVSEEINGVGNFLKNLEELGAVGDFIGGSSVAFLTFSSVIFLVLTIHLQRQELTATRNELSAANDQYRLSNETMQLQKFETTFYNLIDLLDTNKKNIVFSNKKSNEKYLGIDALNEYLKEINKRKVPVLWSSALGEYIMGNASPNDVDVEDSLKRLEEFIYYFRTTNEYARKLEMMSIEDRTSKIQEFDIFIDSISEVEVTNIINGHSEENKGFVKFLQDKIDANRERQIGIRRKQIKDINEEKHYPLDSYINTLKIILKHVDEFDKNQNKELYYNVILSCIPVTERQVLKCFIEYGNYGESFDFFRL